MTSLLQSYDPDWKLRWEHGNAIYDHWDAVASTRTHGDAEYIQAFLFMKKAVVHLRLVFHSQFRTVEEYLAWRIQSLWDAHAWPWLNMPAVPEGLTFEEVNRRLDEAEEFLRSVKARYPHGPRPHHIRVLRRLLAAPEPSARRTRWRLIDLFQGRRIKGTRVIGESPQ